MTYLLAGLSYRRSPVAALERVALGAEELPVWLERLAVHAGGGVILSTCNRTEIYAWSDSTESPARLIELLDDIASRQGAKSPDFEDHVYSATGVDAARHLFRVASGLDSMATGEAQIAGQVRSALLAAGEAGGVAPRLSRLFHTALRTARRVRQATGVEKDSISIPSIGVQLLKQTLDELSGQSVLLIGAGETGTMTARALRRNGVRRLTVTSRRTHRAAELAAELGGTVVAFEERFDALKTADVVVACTAATEPILDADRPSEGRRSAPGPSAPRPGSRHAARRSARSGGPGWSERIHARPTPHDCQRKPGKQGRCDRRGGGDGRPRTRQVRRKTGEPGGRAGGAAPRRAGGADAPGGTREGSSRDCPTCRLNRSRRWMR